MSYVLLHAGSAGSLVADDPIVSARDVAPLKDALAVIARADALAAGLAESREAAERDGREAGMAVGYEDGCKAGAAELGGELFKLSLRDGEAAAKRDAEVAQLALAVVRRIAGELGDEAVVSALAAKAAAAVSPETRATVRVAPTNLEAVRTRLVGVAHVEVESDPSIDAGDCVVETALGRAHAGLETQLAQIERAWADQRVAA